MRTPAVILPLLRQRRAAPTRLFIYGLVFLMTFPPWSLEGLGQVFFRSSLPYQNVLNTVRAVLEPSEALALTAFDCDIDDDGDVDLNDIDALFAARETEVAPGDPLDINGDGVITVNDARLCVLQCSKPECGLNAPPVAVDDAYDVDEDAILTVAAPGVLGNDTDTDNDALTAVLVTDPANGPLTFNPDGSFSYTPEPDFNDSDSFTYKNNDGIVDSSVATVTITVRAVNDSPTITSTSVTEATAVQLYSYDVEATDLDTGDVLTFSLDVAPAGMTIDAATGLIEWTPTQAGDIEVTVRVQDAGGLFDTQSFTIAVQPAPVIVPDVVGLPQADAEAALVATNLIVGPITTANSDTVPAGNIISQDPVAGTSVPAGSAVDLIVSLGPALVAVPDVVGLSQADAEAAIVAADLTVGTITEETSDTIPAGQVINQDPVAGTEVAPQTAVDFVVSLGPPLGNLPPVAEDDTYEFDQDTTRIVAAPGLLANDSDPNGDALTAVPGCVRPAPGLKAWWPGNGNAEDVVGNHHGTLQNGATFAPGQVGQAFSFDGIDDQVTLSSAPEGSSFTIEGWIFIGPNSSLARTLYARIAYGFLLNERRLSWIKGQNHFIGTATIPAGEWHHVAVTFDASRNGPFIAPFMWYLDGQLDGTRNSLGGPLPPADGLGIGGQASERFTFFKDFNGLIDELSVYDQALSQDEIQAIVNAEKSGKCAAINGTVTLNPDGSFTFIPDPGFSGTASFTYRVSDGELESNEATVTLINSANTIPVVGDDVYVVDPDTTLSVDSPGVFANDSDADGDVFTAVLVSGPSRGTLVLRPDGSFTYTPDTGFSGTDSFLYQANDGQTDSGPAQVSLLVTTERDLTIADVDGSSLVFDGQAMTVSGEVTATVTNLGPRNITVPIEVLFFEDINTNSTYDVGTDISLGSTTVTDPLSTGQSTTVTASLSGTVQFSGTVIWGFVDSGNVIAEPNEDNNLARSGQVCEFIPPIGEFDPVVKFHALQGTPVRNTPLVINLTDDNDDGQIDTHDVPDIVFAITAVGRSGPLAAISGDDGRLLFMAGEPNLVASLNEMAVGDIDEDGLPEIIAAHSNNRQLIAFEHTGEIKWFSDEHPLPGRSDSGGAIAIANLDGIGAPEIIIGASVYSAEGQLLGDGRDLGGTTGSIGFSAISAVADVDLDGIPEVIAGPTAYHFVDGALSIVWQANLADGATAGIANFDDDPFAEIVIVSPVTGWGVYMLNHDGTFAEVWNPPTNAPVAFPGSLSGAPAAIGDVDGDGIPEIGVAGQSRYVVFERDGSIRWTSPINDGSKSTGSTVFDFEGDGSAEIVYRDQQFLRIYRGTDGEVLFELAMGAGTGTEMPVVADVDNDGNAEIVVSSDGPSGTGPGVHVIEDANDTWVNTRPIWNQHSYHITNVNDDGTIPLVEANSWEVHNTYRLNQPISGRPFAAPDLIASYVRASAEESELSLTARIGNGGAILVGLDINVAFYDGNPMAGGVLLGVTQTTLRLQPGMFEDVSLTIPLRGVNDLWVVADDDGTGKGQVSECDEANNVYQANISLPPPAGANPPTITSTPPTTVIAGQLYSYDVEATDPDAGETLVFSLLEAPAGMAIDAASGLIEWIPANTQAGDHPVTIRVLDSTGVFDTQSFTVTVIPVDAAVTVPDVVGLPQADAEAALVAANLTVGTITEEHSDTVPAGNVISQEPLAGTAVVPLSGVDLVVSLGPAPNNPPVITSDPVTTGTVETPYTYDVEAIDPDNDPLTFSLAASACLPPPSDLEAWWPGDGTAEDIANGNDGTEQLGAAYGPGWVEQAFQLDGLDDFILIPFSPAFQFGAGEDFTIDAWINLQNPTPGHDDEIVHTEDHNKVRGGVSPDYRLYVVRDIRKFRFELALKGPITLDVDSKAAIRLGKWTHVAAVRQGDQGFLYINGVLDTSAPVPIGSIANSGPLAIGGVYDTLFNPPVQRNHAFGGIIDEVEIHRRALRAEDIQAIFQAGRIGKCKEAQPLPAGMMFDPTTGLITWTPGITQAGTYFTRVEVVDGRGGKDVQVFTITIPALPNDPPVITSTPVTSATVGEPYVYDVEAADPDGDDLTYQLKLNNFAGPHDLAVDATGDIFLVDDRAFGSGAVFRIDPVTGIQTAVSSGEHFVGPRAIAIDAAGHLLIVDPFAFDGAGGIIRVDRATGEQILLTSGGNFVFPTDIAIASTGALFVTDLAMSNGAGGVIQVDPVTGTQTVVSSGGNFIYPVGIAVDSQDNLLIVDRHAFRTSPSDGGGGIIHVDPATGTQTKVASVGGNIISGGIAIAADGAIYLTTFSVISGGQLIRVDPSTGTQTVIASGGMLKIPLGIAPNEAGNLLVADFATSAGGSLIQLDAVTGEQTRVSPIIIDGMSIDPVTGLITWTPSPQQTGVFGATVEALDGRDGTARQSFTITVAPVTTTTIVPDVIGLLQADAEAAIIAAGLTVGTITQTISDTVPAGNVISQNPVAGTTVNNGSSVDLVVSLGQSTVTVPAVVGLPQADAEAALVAANLTVGTITRVNSDTVPVGNIISQDPAAGTEVPAGSTVDLVVSSGPPPPATLESILIQPENPLILETQTQPFSAIGILANGSSQNLTGQVTWGSSTLTTASIDTNGVATGLLDGTTTISATLGSITGSTTLTVRASVADVTLPTAAITAPADNSTLLSPTDIIGTATDDNFLKYIVEFAPFGETTFTTLTVGTTPVTNSVLGTFDPTLLINDLYTLRLTVIDRAANTSQTSVTYQVARDQKVGNFTLAFEDLNVPVSGLPITVNRVYDSRDKNVGDFGFGWRLDVQSIQLRVDGVHGTNWEITESGGLFPTFTLIPIGEHKVSITLPDGKVEEFDFTPTPRSQQLAPLLVTTAVYTPRPGTRGTLVPLGERSLAVQGAQPGLVDLMLESDFFTLYDPQGFEYISADGTVFTIDRTTGVESVRDLNGNTLTFGPNGITHSAGKGITFDRDAQGRITQLTDPNGNSQQYTYDANGDLASHTDAEGNTTTFLYNFRHGLIEIQDPRGISPIRNEYDDAGRLIANVDANGNRIEYTHNIGARQEVITDRLGRITVFNYDEAGNVLSQTDALGNTTTFTYDSRGNQLTETDALGNTTISTYDARDNVLTQTDPLGNTTIFTYNALNQVLTITDPLGNVATNTYDANGNLLTTTNALGSATTNTYDASGNLLSTTDSLGQATTFAYDTVGNLTSQTDSLSNQTTFTYDTNGNQLTQTTTRTDGLGNTVSMTTTTVYDSNNRLVQATDPDGASTVTEYNAIGKQAAIIDKNGNRTEFTYDALGNLIQTTFPDGTTETTAYDAAGSRTSSIDRAGRTTSFTYDALNRLTSTGFPDGSSTQTAYDAAGRVTDTTDENRNTSTFGYDAAGRRATVTDALGNVTSFTYDANGNQLRMTDANGNTTQFAYDANNRRTQTTFSDGTPTTTSYDSLGRKVAETDQAGNTTQFAYDALGRLIGITDALGNITSYTYDEAGNRLTQTDANGNTTLWAYDNLGRVTSRALPLGMVETFTYDANGNVLSKTDFNGQTTTFSYDVNNRLLQKTFPTSQVSFTYTPTGQQATVTDPRGVTSHSYDARDRLLQMLNPDGTALTYTYDAAGNRTSVTVPSGTTTYTFDALNRLGTVTDPNAGVTAYAYDNVGNRASVTYPNGTIAQYTYDTLNRLTLLENLRSDLSVISSYTYTLGPAGNRTRVEEDTGRIVDYTYDALFRLVQENITDATLGNETIAYTYDAVGNRLTRTDSSGTTTYTYDDNDRLLTEDGKTYTYDDNGNTLSVTDTVGTTTYDYDVENRLISTETPSSTIGYAYDADGIRVQTTVDGVVTDHVVDKNRPFAQVLEERDDTGGLVVSYVYGDDLISQERSGEVSYYHYDGLGSTRALTDNIAAATDTYTYEAFGGLLGSVGSTINNYRFTGEQFDPNVGFYYLRARYLNPSIGRFVTIDSFEGSIFDPISLHKYLYVRDNPGNFVDLSGNFSFVELATTPVTINILFSLAWPTLLKGFFTFVGVKWLMEPGFELRNFSLEAMASGRLGPEGWEAAEQVRDAGLIFIQLGSDFVDATNKLATFLSFNIGIGKMGFALARAPRVGLTPKDRLNFERRYINIKNEGDDLLDFIRRNPFIELVRKIQTRSINWAEEIRRGKKSYFDLLSKLEGSTN